jgi:aryl-alcohol dehydrogenase-like predicted oxidoreductase
MSHEEALAKVSRLKAVTVERGATPAEAATAALLAERLISQIARRRNSVLAPQTRCSALAPGVHVTIV